jgi:hypothetical protein
MTCLAMMDAGNLSTIDKGISVVKHRKEFVG